MMYGLRTGFGNTRTDTPIEYGIRQAPANFYDPRYNNSMKNSQSYGKKDFHYNENPKYSDNNIKKSDYKPVSEQKLLQDE